MPHEPQHSIDHIVICMRVSASMLELAGEDTKDKNFSEQARLLWAAAADLKLREQTHAA